MKSPTKSMALGAAALALASPAAAAPVLWSGNGHYYEYVSSAVTFEGALAAAETAVFTGYEGYLATITSADENAFIASLVVAGRGSYGQTWVGGSDRETEGVWKWITGPEIGTVFYNGGAVLGQYSNFPNGEPNNNGPENGLSAFYFGNLQWNDLSTSAANGYVVEYRLAPPSGGVPEPAIWAMMILGFGLAGSAVRRRRLSPAA